MHDVWIGSVVPDHVDGNAFPKVGFYGVDSLFKESANFVLIPLFGVWIGEINQCHSRLPHVPLPDTAVGTLDEVTVGQALIEKDGPLGDVGVHPGAEV